LIRKEGESKEKEKNNFLEREKVGRFYKNKTEYKVGGCYKNKN